jgi:hypothetical protein
MLRYNDQGGLPSSAEFYNGNDWSTLTTGGTIFAWGKISQSGALLSSYNIASCTIAAGNYKITFTNPAPSAEYVVAGMSITSTVCWVKVDTTNSNPTTTDFECASYTASGTLTSRPFSFVVIVP